MFCEKCGKAVTDNEKLCHECRAMEVASSNVQGFSSVSGDALVDTAAKKKKGLIIGIIAVAIIAIIACIGIFAYPSIVKATSPKSYYNMAQKNTAEISTKQSSVNSEALGFDLIGELVKDSYKESVKIDLSEISTGYPEIDEVLKKISLEGTGAIDFTNRKIYSSGALNVGSIKVDLGMFMDEDNLAVSLPFYGVVSILDKDFVSKFNKSDFVQIMGELPEDLKLEFADVIDNLNFTKIFEDLLKTYTPKIEKLLDDANYEKGEKKAIDGAGDTMYDTVKININSEEFTKLVKEMATDYYNKIFKMIPAFQDNVVDTMNDQLDKVKFENFDFVAYIDSKDRVIATVANYKMTIDQDTVDVAVNVSDLGMDTSEDNKAVDVTVKFDEEVVKFAIKMTGNSTPVNGKVDSKINISFDVDSNPISFDIGLKYDTTVTDADNMELLIKAPDFGVTANLSGSISIDKTNKKFALNISKIKLAAAGETLFDSKVNISYSIEKATDADFVDIKTNSVDLFNVDIEEFVAQAGVYVSSIYEKFMADFPELYYQLSGLNNSYNQIDDFDDSDFEVNSILINGELDDDFLNAA